jgi:hypothetical protein
VREVGRREVGEEYFGAKGGEKSLGRGRGCVLVHLLNGLNGLILNWCTGGCWFTPAIVLGREMVQCGCTWRYGNSVVVVCLFVREGSAPVWVFFFPPLKEEEMVFPSTVRHGCQRCTRRDALRTADNNDSMPVVDTISVRDEVEQLGRSKSTASSCTCTMP